jgi:hypothetical protein
MAQRGIVEDMRQRKRVRMGTGVNVKMNGALLLEDQGTIVLKMYMVWGGGANLFKPLAMKINMSACLKINEDMTRYCILRIRKDRNSSTSNKEMRRTGLFRGWPPADAVLRQIM